MLPAVATPDNETPRGARTTVPAEEILLETPRFRVIRQARTDSRGQSFVRETVVHPGAVAIVPLLDDGRICLIRNHRVSVGKTLVELPAGTLEPNEGPLATAQRELAEETGFTAAKWEPLGEFFMSPGILSERMHLFVARELTDGAARPEVGEDIDRFLGSWDEALAMIDRGEIEDAKTVAGLLMCARRLGL